MLAEENAEPEWHPFRPRPTRIPLSHYLLRLLWNPQGNEALYLLSSSEKILERDSPQAREVIAARIAQAIKAGHISTSLFSKPHSSKPHSSKPPSTTLFRFRLMEVERVENELVRRERFISPVFSVDQAWKPIP
ncbi:MAG TPA: hypothetical protein VM553_07275 [Dongiaceae bacterium]|nr:hypothetical protein [Dongiaceae bacterium]